MYLLTEWASGTRLDLGSGPWAERRPAPAGPPGSAPQGSAEGECSGTAGTGCKSERAAGWTGLRWI